MALPVIYYWQVKRANLVQCAGFFWCILEELLARYTQCIRQPSLALCKIMRVNRYNNNNNNNNNDEATMYSSTKPALWLKVLLC